MDIFDTYKILGSAVESQEYSMNFYAKKMSNIEHCSYKRENNNLYKQKNAVFKFSPIKNDNSCKIGGVKLKIEENKVDDGFVSKSLKNNKFSNEKYNSMSDLDFINNYIGFIESSNQYKIDLSMLNSNKSIILNTLSIIEK
ncbi:Flagellar basal-body rod protein FlgC [Buchnera aphidicola (Anoecia corni)]|uniref:Flagellar basal-body rod protein FlgC n=1 Tax=Buchnera aphidicola (Anoecia corni) TaxID=2994477 RepID=A0AAT9IHA7_9GAMM